MSEWCDLDVEVTRESKSGQALQVFCGKAWHWIPKSQVYNSHTVVVNPGVCQRLSVKTWIANSKGLI